MASSPAPTPAPLRSPLTPDTARLRVRRALRAAAERHRVDPDWLDAIGKKESEWNLGAVNHRGPDLARGSAWGPCQITAATARLHGYQGNPAALAADLELHAEWAARILAAGRPHSFAEACAVWNAGRYGADRNHNGQLEPGEAPERTVAQYWPKAQDALRFVRANPPPPERA